MTPSVTCVYFMRLFLGYYVHQNLISSVQVKGCCRCKEHLEASNNISNLLEWMAE